LAVLLTRGLQRRAWPLAYALPVAAAAAFVFGLWTEVFQGSVPGRQTTVDDLVVDAIGIGLAAMILMLLETARNRGASTCPRFFSSTLFCWSSRVTTQFAWSKAEARHQVQPLQLGARVCLVSLVEPNQSNQRNQINQKD